MKIVLAPDSFKGSLSQKEAIEAMAEGIRDADAGIETECIPVADGGEGTLYSIMETFGGQTVEKEVCGPYGERVTARYLIKGDTAYIEMAESSGLNVTDRRDVIHSTTFGTGELVLDAARRGARNICITFGGSATNDGGAGILEAFGYLLLDDEGKRINPGNYGLQRLFTIDCSHAAPELKDVSFVLACDVRNTLCGRNGATYVFGPQKGGSGEELEIMDFNLFRYAQLLERQTGRKILGLEGGGAAGGATIPFMAFYDARVVSGIDMVLSLAGFEDRIRDADMVFTGEGRYDSQTQYGKAIYGIRKITESCGKRLIVFAGSVEKEEKDVFEISDRSRDLSANMAEAHLNLRRSVAAFLGRELHR